MGHQVECISTPRLPMTSSFYYSPYRLGNNYLLIDVPFADKQKTHRG
jgi:hypothetical protein